MLEAAERELPHVVAAGHAPSRFPSRLLGGEEQGEEDADDRDDRQDFNVDEGRAARPRLREHGGRVLRWGPDREFVLSRPDSQQALPVR